MNNVKIKILIAACVILAGGFFGYKYYTDKVTEETTKTYETEPVRRMDLTRTVSATGTIQPRESVEVSSKVTARVKEIPVQENDTVQAGQVVAILEGKDYEARLNQAQFTLTNASQKLTRTKRLYEIGAKSLEEYQDAQYAYDKAKTELDVAESEVNDMIITAPIDGVVVGEPLTPGSMAVQGSNNPTVILRIADLSEKLVKAKVDETDIGSIRVGERATFTVDAHPNETFDAIVTKISQTDTSNSWNINSSSSSSSSSSSNAVIYYYVTFQAPDPKNLLLPAMTARLDIIVGQVRNALCVPIAAVKTDGKGSYVERVTTDEKGTQTAEKVYITIGLYGEDYVEVKKGNLNAGDEISTTYEAQLKSPTQGGARRGPFGF